MMYDTNAINMSHGGHVGRVASGPPDLINNIMSPPLLEDKTLIVGTRAL